MNRQVPDQLGEGPVITWYGDDFTGSAGVLEVLAEAGLSAVLFMDIPTSQELAPYASWQGIGVAGTARRHDPAWMKENLPAVFEFLSDLSAPIAHYKVCSTFDSSPTIGSIGTATELGIPILGGEWTPLVVAAPPVGRYQLFGNLFAVADGVVYRLDRHPTMSRHPVTPMREADVRLHLADQTSSPVGLVDALSLQAETGDEALQQEIAEGNPTVALDVVDEETLAEVGRLIWEHRGNRLFAVGSQGVEYALIRHWRQAGLIDPNPPTTGFEPAEHFIGMSASISPVTGAQLQWADDHGFELIRLDVDAVVDSDDWSLEIDRVSEKAMDSVTRGRDPIVYTASGPNDPSEAKFRAAVESSEMTAGAARERIGDGLGAIVDRLVSGADITRIAVAGGDTSSHVVRALGVRSLSFMAPIEHGVSMMNGHRVNGDDPPLEISLKGGQMGSVEYFGTVKSGREST